MNIDLEKGSLPQMTLWVRALSGQHYGFNWEHVLKQ